MIGGPNEEGGGRFWGITKRIWKWMFGILIAMVVAVIGMCSTGILRPWN